MNKFTRTLALLLALLLSLSCLQPSALAAEAVAAAWNGIPATSFSGGTGTESDPYLISNGGELAYLAQKVNESNSTSNPYRGAWYKLTADIDLGNQEWTPIGWNASTSYYFCGTFLGGGHTISHLKISGNVNDAGLFGSIANANICNLTLRDSSIVSSGYHVGAFVGSTGASSETLCNLHVVDTTVQGKYAVGGIVGYASAGSGYTITLCCSSVQGATITGTQYGVGGVVGQAGGSGGTANISRSWCAASQVSSTSYGGAGGIVGMVANNSTVTVGQRVHIADCYNTANVTVGTPASSNVYDAAGGIVGYSKSAYLTVDRCYNTGVITAGRCMGKSSLTYAAGICGYSIGGTYTGCYNAGQLETANTNTSYKSTLSGIRCNSGTVNYCYYTPDCFPVSSSYFTKSTSGTEIADVAAIVARISQDPAWTGTGYWKLEDGNLPTLTGCIPSNGICTCGCGCHCVPAEPEPEETVYTLIYDANGGNEPNWTETQSTTEETATFTVSDTLPTRDGYTFLGWADTAEATTANYHSGNTIALVKAAPTKTISAVWEKNAPVYDYALTYDINGGNEPNWTETQSTTAEAATFTVSDTIPTRDGYTFLGWADTADAAAAIYQAGACITLSKDAPTKTIYAVWGIPEDVLLLCDGVTGEVLEILDQEDYTSGRNDLLADNLGYWGADFTVDGTRKTVGDAQYTFAGWFYTPCGTQAGHEIDWTAENNVGTTDLFHNDKVQNQRIYAYWIDAGYSKAQIGYWADTRYARDVYINATVPDDLFPHYGFVVSTTATEEDASSLVIGGTINGKPVGNFEKSTVYEAFQASPIYEQSYTAKDFNHGLPGYNSNGNGNGYVTYFYWRYMQLRDTQGNLTTLSTRAYYRTLEGTLVYGDMSSCTFRINTVYNPLAATAQGA